MSDIQYVYPLIHNKVTSPHFVTPTLRRQRLIDWLNEHSSRRAIVIAADAGYGKTTLLWQWEQEVDFPIFWYKLDRDDRDWSLHVSYLIETISRRHPGFGKKAHSVLQQLGGPGSSRPGVVAYLLAEMYEFLRAPCTFVIDDWQAVSSVTEVRGLWNQILRDSPPTCRFVFLSRARPQLQLARFKTHDGYAELDTAALRFNDTEIAELFRDVYRHPLESSELVEVDRRTEGWAASLQMLEVSLKERKTVDDRMALIASIDGSSTNVFDFLAEEVLDQQEANVRELLLATSIVQQITPELAERLAGVQDGRRVLSALENRGLFTYRLDSQTQRYRFHGLFRDFLEKRLVQERSEGEVTGLHIHAGSYFETTRQWPEAIHHYLRAALQGQAARLIARYGEDLSDEGRLGLIDEWLRQIPNRTIIGTARLALLHGEALGMRGQWTDALAMLGRARQYFSRKGDRRMEALACLKTSTVHANHGSIAQASTIAREGLDLAPHDAHATRMRLEGNLAITSTWMTEHLQLVARTCSRIAAEAQNRGLDHSAAIAYHNLGIAQRQMGRFVDSIRSLQLASAHWDNLPANPFADNAELVQSLVAIGEVDRALALAESGVKRTGPWPRPNAEARYGLAVARVAAGQLSEAVEITQAILAQPASLGPTAELVASLLVECLFLLDDDGSDWEYLAQTLSVFDTDPRQAASVAPARALLKHMATRCKGECLAEIKVLSDWDRRGATFPAAAGYIKIGPLAGEHGDSSAFSKSLAAATAASSVPWSQQAAPWIRRYARYPSVTAASVDGQAFLVALLARDPDAWHDAAIAALPTMSGEHRAQALSALIHLGRRETVPALQQFSADDIATARRRLQRNHAPRIFIKSFGALSAARDSWDGVAVPIERRRMRALLGLLVAYFEGTLTRDMALDTLWPESDVESALNSLNQTVYQLRRAIDPTYRDGESPPYVISTADSVALNADLVRTDLGEFRRYGALLRLPSGSASHRAALAAIGLVRGEYLAELKYEDWAARIQTKVHAEVRDTLLPLAQGSPLVTPDLAVRAASALIELDEYDEAAQIAMARQLAHSGKRAAARRKLEGYAKRVRNDLAEELSPELAQALAALGGRAGPVQ